MNWHVANATQTALAEAERSFMDVCNTDEEVDDARVEAAYARMAQAAAAADEALNTIKGGVDDWAPVVASVLR